MRNATLTLLAGIVLYACTPVMAGFVPDSFDVEFGTPRPHPGPGGRKGPPAWANAPEWVVDMVGDKHELANLDLTEALGGAGEYPVSIAGQTDEDPDIHVTKTVENDTDYDWDRYEVRLDGAGGATFVGTATSDTFTVISQDALKIVYGGSNPVLQGATVILDFDVNIPTTGDFGFTLTQVIPEPTTLCMLAVGAGLAIARRQRR